MSIIPSKVLKTLNPEPDMKFDFKNQAFLDLITFPANPNRDPALPTNYRLSNATRINAEGMVESVGFHHPRLQYDPTTKEKLGMILEPYAKNYAKGIDDFVFGGWTYTNISNIGFHPSPCVDVNHTQAVIFQTNNDSTSRIHKLFSGDFISKYITISVYVKYIGGIINKGNLISITGYSSEDSFISHLSLIKDEKWHRYSITFFSPSSNLEIEFMRNMNLGCKLAIFGVQFEIGEYATSLIHPQDEERQADDFVLPFTESDPESEGSISLGVIPLRDPETNYSLYPIKNTESGSFPELQIGKESVFSTSFVSDTSWLAKSPDSGLVNFAVHAHEAGTWTHAIAGATWIWRTFNTIPGEIAIEFTKYIELPDEPTSAAIQIAADDDYLVFINDILVASGTHAWTAPTTHSNGAVLSALRKGNNKILIHVGNNGLVTAGMLCKIDISCKPTSL